MRNMVIEAGKVMLLLRYNNYKKTDFIEEHNKVSRKNGYVWMLKAGRKLVENKLKNVMEESSIIILKAPKNAGGEYYFTELLEFRYGKQQEKNDSPEYYASLVDDERLWQIDSLDGTWLKIGKIRPLNKQIVDELKLISNDKMVQEVVSSTMSSTLYVCVDKDITLSEEV